MTTELSLGNFASSLSHLENLVNDIPDDRMTEQPAGLRNHPAWTLMHLGVGHDFMLAMLGVPTQCPAGWDKLTGPGSIPVADRTAYAGKAEALGILRRQHELAEAAVKAATPQVLMTQTPEQIRGFAPTIGHIVSFMLNSHEWNHLGQLQAWKRAAGLAKA